VSHAEGQIIKDDQIVAYYEYDGCSDFCFTKLYKSREELTANWRTNQFAKCTCGKAEPVLVYSSYGNGGWWAGKACLECMALTEGTSHDFDDFEYLGDGHPLGHWQWPWDGQGNILPDGVKPEDEPRLRKRVTE